MSNAAFLSRRLTSNGCVIAGTQLASHREDLKGKLKDKKIKVTAKVDAAVQAVMACTETIESLPTNDATMIEVDRGADRCIAGIGAELDNIERAFDHQDILPLTDDEAARRSDGVLVRSEALASGIGFIKLPYSQQWRHMNDMVKALDRKDVRAAVERLGLSVEVGRLRRWTELYGAKLGLTEAKDADPAAKAVEAWHEAYGTLVVQVHAEYDDKNDKTHALIRERLLSPYDSAAEEERRADQRARAAAKKKNEPEPT